MPLTTALRIVYLGRRCAFSQLPLEALLAAGGSVVGLIIPGAAAGAAWQPLAPPDLPQFPEDVVRLAQARGIPVFAAGRLRDPAAVAGLQALRPDVLCAACFPRRLPAEWLALPRLGALNIHPALLPDYRGPEPIFWQFREGEPRLGVTVHQMDAGFDTGPLVAQAETPWPDGLREAEAERITAAAGGRLLAEILQAERWETRPQPAAGARYFPAPAAADLTLTTEWPARRAFNFLRGAAGWGPLTILGPAGRWRAADALAWTTGEPPPAAVEAGAAWVPFAGGAVLVRLASDGV